MVVTLQKLNSPRPRTCCDERSALWDFSVYLLERKDQEMQ